MSRPFTQKPPFGTQLDLGHPRTRGLVGAWDFLGNAGALAIDSRRAYGNGTISNGPLIKNLQGGGNQLNLVGASSQSITFPYNPNYPNCRVFGTVSRAAISFQVLCILPSLSGFYGLVDNVGAGTTLIDTFMNNNTWTVAFGGGGSTGIAALTPGTLYALMVVIDDGNSQMRSYVNGVLVNTQNTDIAGQGPTGRPETTNNWHLGGRGSPNFITGQFASVRFWRRCLTVKEIEQEYRSPWEIYKRIFRIGYKVSANAFNEEFSLGVNSLSVALSALRNSLLAIELDAGVTIAVSTQAALLGSMTLATSADSLIGGSNNIDSSIAFSTALDNLIAGARGVADSITLGLVSLDTQASQQRNSPLSVTLAVQNDCVFATAAALLASATFAVQVDASPSNIGNFAQALALAAQAGFATSAALSLKGSMLLNLSITGGIDGGFLFERDFDLDLTVDVPEMVSGFQYAVVMDALAVEFNLLASLRSDVTGLLSFALSLSIQSASSLSAIASFPLSTLVGYVQRNNIDVNSSISLGITVDVAAAVAFLYALTMEIAAEFDMTPANSLGAVASIALGVELDATLATQRNTHADLSLGAAITVALTSNVQLQALLSLGATLGLAEGVSKGRTLDLALGFVAGMLAAQGRTSGGAGGFTNLTGGIPHISEPVEAGEPGIFGELVEEEQPGIWKPRNPLP